MWEVCDARTGVLGLLVYVSEMSTLGTWPSWGMKFPRAAHEKVWLPLVGMGERPFRACGCSSALGNPPRGSG